MNPRRLYQFSIVFSLCHRSLFNGNGERQRLRSNCEVGCLDRWRNTMTSLMMMTSQIPAPSFNALSILAGQTSRLRWSSDLILIVCRCPLSVVRRTPWYELRFCFADRGTLAHTFLILPPSRDARTSELGLRMVESSSVQRRDRRGTAWNSRVSRIFRPGLPSFDSEHAECEWVYIIHRFTVYLTAVKHYLWKIITRQLFKRATMCWASSTL